MSEPQSSNVTTLPSSPAQRWAGILLVLAALVLYLTTLDNGLQPEELRGGDLITHQYAQVQARPSNAPGYPLYTMGGWLWFHGLQSVGRMVSDSPPNPIPLLSSYSTLWALLAVWLLYAIICRLTRRTQRLAGYWQLAWLMAAFYAVTYFFWYYATTTEQYSSAIAQTLAIIYVYLLWRDVVAREGAVVDDSKALALLWLLAFLCGLSLAHMLTIAFIVPPLVIVVLWQAPDLLRSPKTILGSIAAAAIPLAGYFFVYIRGAVHPEWWGEGNWTDANDWFWTFVSTAQGREELGWGFEAGVTLFANGFPELIWQELSIPLLMMGLLGILLFDRRLITLLYGTIAITLLFSWAYRYGNWYQVILPIYPLILLGNVAIIDRWTRWWEKRQRNGQSGNVTVMAALSIPLLLLVLATGWRLVESLPAADSRDRGEDTALRQAAILLDQTLPVNYLFATVDDALAIQYLSDIWGIQPQVEVVSSLMAGELLSAGQSVLSTVDAAPILRSELPADLETSLGMLSADWLIVDTDMSPQNQQVVSSNLELIHVDVDTGENGDISLLAYGVQPAPGGVPVVDSLEPAIDLTLAWRLLDGTWPGGVAMSIRPTSEGAFLPDLAGEPNAILQRDVAQPTLTSVENSAGIDAGPLLDIQRIPFPDSADSVMLILYRQSDDGFENLAEIQLPVKE